MANLGYDFNAMEVPVDSGIANLPLSDLTRGHLVMIVGDEWKPTNAGDGMNLEFTLEIIEDGPLKGVRGIHRLCLQHPNPDTVRIAHTGQAGLSALARVTGVYNLSDSRGGTNQLHRIPFRVIVEPQKKKPEYTQVTRVLDANGNEPNKAGAPAPGAQPAGSTGWAPAPPAETAPPAPPAPAWQPGGTAPPTKPPWQK